MQALASQERFDELQASAPDAADGDTSHSDELADRIHDPSAAGREIERLLLDIAARAYLRAIRPARPVEAPPLSVKPFVELPLPSKYLRRK